MEQPSQYILELEIRENINPRGDGNFEQRINWLNVIKVLDKREYNSERRRKF